MVIWNYETAITRRNGDTHFVQTDKEDFALLSDRGWCVQSSGATFYCVKYPSIQLHRFIMGLENNGVGVVDHKNGNGLDNRRSNLRICTIQENNFNRKKYKNNTSDFKGVSWNQLNQNWRARIQYNKKVINIGSFDTPEKASKAYEVKATELFGEFKRL